MSEHRRSFHSTVPILLFLLGTSWTAACQPASEALRAQSWSELRELESAREAIDPGAVDHPLLAEAIFHQTNVRRVEHGRDALSHMVDLDRAACGHAEAMVELDFFSHRHPSDESLATPADRVRAQGLELGFVAENIGEVFAVRYEAGEAVYVRTEGERTVFSRQPGGEPLGRRTYLETAEALLDSWMASEGHRANVLSEAPERFGSGCALSRDDQLDMPMFSCVQLFFAPLRSGM